MRIVVDMQGAQTESRFRGIGRYTMAFTKAIVRNRGNHEVILALSGLFPDTISPIISEFEGLLSQENILVWRTPAQVFEAIPANTARREVAELVYEAFLSSLSPDIIHISSLFEGYYDEAVTSIESFDRNTPVSASFYDLIPLLNYDQYLKPSPLYEQHYKRKIRHIEQASIILAISEFSKQEALEHLDISKDSIVNVSSAIEPCFQKMHVNDDDANELYQKFGIDRPFILYTGAADERKNLPRLIKAFAMLPSELRARHQLVLAGRTDEITIAQLKSQALSAGLQSTDIRLTGYVTEEEIFHLYNLCKLYVFPSWHEGFGLPALEAMACGAPVIGANTSSLPEVIGLSDALFDPLNVESISEKMAYALENDAFRAELEKHGLQQAKLFSWDKSAERAIEAWEKNQAVRFSDQQHRDRSWCNISNRLTSIYKRIVPAIANTVGAHGLLDDFDLRRLSICIENNERQVLEFLRRGELPEKIVWRIEGPFDSSYSLSLVNREMARALSGLGHDVVLHSTEGPGDFPAKESFLENNPDIACMHSKVERVPQCIADVSSRNLYPPRVEDMRSRMNFLHAYGWEESGFPYEWVESFNRSLQGITVMSEHVRKVMIDNGVTVPIAVSGIGADHWVRIKTNTNYALEAHKFRFLHVSSCFPRKGADVMLKAFGQAFRAKDDVSLIIKTFHNPHNEIQQWLDEASAHDPEFPDVQVIEDDYDESDLKALYEQCHVLVAPSRGEGFGLPMAEAILSGLAVIATGWSGQMDFCTPETAWIVDYKFTPAATHFGVFSSVWAEPDVMHLKQLMREVYELPESERDNRVVACRKLLMDRFRWSTAAKKMVNAARTWGQTAKQPEPRIGWVTTWNTRCGIATYSGHLTKNMPAEIKIFAAHSSSSTDPVHDNVECCWYLGGQDPLIELRRTVKKHRLNAIVIQFNYGFFDFQSLSDFIIEQIDNGRVVVVMMHSTTDSELTPYKKLSSLIPALAQCHRVLVHAANDLNRLKSRHGLVNNVALFPHGVIDYSPEEKMFPSDEKGFVIASYGFFLPHKGLLELIDAVALLRKQGTHIYLHMINAEYPAPESKELIEQAEWKISNEGLSNCISLCTEYLSDSECLERLSKANLIVFPYQSTGESSSAAVRYGLATGRPVAVTPLAIFDDVKPAVHDLPGLTPELMAHGIADILKQIVDRNPAILEKHEIAERWRAEHRYSRVSDRLYGMIVALNNAVDCNDSTCSTMERDEYTSEEGFEDGEGVRVVRSLPELDKILKELDYAAAISDDELRHVFNTFEMKFSSELPVDPYSSEYRKKQFGLYKYLTGKTYAITNEITNFNIDSASVKPFPFYTRSSSTVGNHLIAIGHLIRTMKIPAGSTILEFGPGWGNTTVFLARMGFRVTAVDIEKKFVDLIDRRCRQKSLDVEVIEGDFAYIDNAERTWDAVLFFECFHHCSDHQSLIAGLENVISPGGKVFFAAEPITDDFPIPWGFRLDGESLWAIRRNGWCELGFQESYFREIMNMHGWDLTKNVCSETPWGTIFVASRQNEMDDI